MHQPGTLLKVLVFKWERRHLKFLDYQRPLPATSHSSLISLCGQVCGRPKYEAVISSQASVVKSPWSHPASLPRYDPYLTANVVERKQMMKAKQALLYPSESSGAAMHYWLLWMFYKSLENSLFRPLFTNFLLKKRCFLGQKGHKVETNSWLVMSLVKERSVPLVTSHWAFFRRLRYQPMLHSWYAPLPQCVFPSWTKSFKHSLCNLLYF